MNSFVFSLSSRRRLACVVFAVLCLAGTRQVRAVDKLYYLSNGGTGTTPATTDALRVINSDGTSDANVFNASSVANPNAVAIDVTNNRAFVADSFNGLQKIYTVNLSTGAVTSFLDLTAAPYTVNAMEVDRTNSKLYYLAAGGSGSTPASTDTLRVINLDGTGDANVFNASSLANPNALALDIANNRAFVADSFNGLQKIYAVNLSTGAVTSFLDLTAAPYTVSAMKVDTVNSKLYYLSQGGSGSTAASTDALRVINLNGTGDANVFNTNTIANPNALALDVTNNQAFVADSFNGLQKIYKVNLSTGAVTSFLDLTAAPYTVAAMELVVTPPSITSTLTASGTYGSAISTYTITASNSPSSYNATGLPPGLSVNTTNGQITGTPTSTAGSPYSVTISATNLGGTGTATLTFTIAKKGLTVSGVTASNRAYDATTSATALLNFGSATLVGVVGGDTVTLNTGSATGTFASATIGSGKTITIAGLTISGTSSGNYTLTQPTTTATVTAKALSTSGLSATGKTYDALTTATLSGTAALLTAESPGTGTTSDGKPYTGDTVSLTGTPSGTYADRHAATNKTVTVTGLSLTGAQAGNYTLTAPTPTATITAKALTAAGLTGVAKTYDAQTSATLSGTAALLTAENAGVGTTSDGKPYTGDTVSLTGTPSGAFADRHVGTSKTVTVSGLSLSGAQAGDYSLTAPTTTATISVKALTTSGLTAVDKTYDAQTSATLSGTAALLTAENPGVGTTSDGKPYTGDTVSLAGTPSGVFADRHVGTGKTVTVSGLSLSGAQATDYSLTAPAPTATISTKALTTSGLTAVNKTYDALTTATLSGTTALLTAENPGVGTTSDGKPYTGDTVALTGTPSGAFADRNAGAGKTVTVSGLSLSGAQAGDYSLTAPAPTATISTKALTASGLTGVNKTYDASLTATLSGTAALLAAENPGVGTTSDNKPYTGDTVAVGGTPSGAFADRAVGTGKTITVSGLSLSGAQAGNYALSAITGVTANITTASLSITGVTANNKVYNATTAATLNTASAALSGVLGTDVVTLSTSGASGTFATKTIGTAKPVTTSGFAIGGADAGNYVLTQPATTADITTASLSITGVTANNKVYNATTAATLNTASAALSGVLGTDVVTLSTSSASGTFATKTIGTAKPVTTSGFAIGGADAGNYVLTQPATTADITTASLSITGVTANNKVYDATTAATLNTGSAALSGVQGSDSVTLNTGSAAGAFATKTAGSAKPVSTTGFSISGTDAGNYTLTQPSTTADISAAGLSVTGITASNKVYDATTAATIDTSSAALSGVLGSDVVTLDVSGATGAFATKVVGSGKTVTISGVSIGGTDFGNYTLTPPTATANITAAGLSVSGVTASDKVYDATTTASLDTSGATLNGVLGSDVVTLNATSAAGTFDTKNTGTGKTVTVAGLGLGGADAGNYTLTQPTALAAITPKGLTVTADDKSRVYGTANPTFTATISGFAGGETVSVLTGAASLSTAATTASLPGTYPITAAAGTLAANNSNYTFSFVAGTLTITSLTYADWAAQEFTPSEQADAAISGPSADPDDDGVINLLEYALALHPKMPDRTGLPIIGTVSDSGSTYAAITYPRRVGASDLSYAVQASANLSTWSGTGVVELGAVDLGATEGVSTRDGSALGTGSRRFLRLQVTLTSVPQTAATDALGAVALTVDGAGSASNARVNLIGLPLTAPVVYQGRISSVSGSTVVQSISNWADDAFNGAAGTYFLEIASGSNAGFTLDITATSAASHSLTVASAIDTYASAGDTFKVRRHLTLTDVFGATNNAGLVAGTLATADLVQAYLPGTQTYVSYYYQNSGAGGTGWRTSASTSVDAAQTPLYFDEGLLVRKQTGPLTWILTGAVKTGPTIFAVAPGVNYLPNVYPAGSLTLGSCQIYTGSAATGLAGGTVTTADLIDILNVSQGIYTNYYYRTTGLGGTGWRANTSIFADAAGTEIPIGVSVHLQRKASGTFLWHVPQPF